MPQKLAVRPTPRVVVDDNHQAPGSQVSYFAKPSSSAGATPHRLTSALKSNSNCAAAAGAPDLAPPRSAADPLTRTRWPDVRSMEHRSHGPAEGGVVAAYRSDSTGTVGFYRTSIHTKNPQMVFMTSSSNTIAADTVSSSLQSAAAAQPAAPQLRDASPLLDRYRAGAALRHTISTTGGRPRWNAPQAKRTTPPPQQITADMIMPGSSGNSPPDRPFRSASAPKAPVFDRSGSPPPPGRGPVPSSYVSIRGHAAASNTAGGAARHQDASVVSATSISNHPTAHFPNPQHHRRPPAQSNLVPVNMSNASNGSHPYGSQPNAMFVHSCQDQHCVHNRGDIMEVIVAKSQVRAMESQLAQTELRCEQLQAKVLYEHDRAESLHAKLQAVQLEKHHASEALDEMHASLSAYQSVMVELDRLKQHVAVLEKEREDSLRREEGLRAQCSKLEAAVINQSASRGSNGATSIANDVWIAAEAAQVSTLSAFSVFASSAARAGASTVGDTAEAVPRRVESALPSGEQQAEVQALKDELLAMREAKLGDDKVRRELLRALADKERQVANLVGSQVMAAQLQLGASPQQLQQTLLQSSMTPAPSNPNSATVSPGS